MRSMCIQIYQVELKIKIIWYTCMFIYHLSRQRLAFVCINRFHFRIIRTVNGIASPLGSLFEILCASILGFLLSK
ncbi:hypothetical protein HanIR_Chr15g0751921 [Helianthus annuus]|nr:hypothetical protein HanIR_Chr15g0751921 [Helianthus annuus]